MPWEETQDSIRSGHQDPDKFDADSFRVIDIDPNQGIKAVIACPKGQFKAGECQVGTQTQSFIFTKDKGWTLEKAKQWFEQYRDQEKVRLHKHVSAILPFRMLEKIVDKPLRIKGTAMTAGMSRNFNIYTPEELQAFARKIVNSPVYIEHVAVPNAVGLVTKTQWDPESMSLFYEAEIYDEETADKIRRDLIQHVSIGADYETIDVLDGKVPHGLHNAELSLVAVPGIPETNIQVIEKVAGSNPAKEQAEPQDFILYPIRDLAVFMPEHFQVNWIDQNLGIQALYGRLIENPESIQPFALLFMKAKDWTPNKIESWLADHPQYARPSLAPQPVGVQVQTPAPPKAMGVEKMSEEKPKENKLQKEQKPEGEIDLQVGLGPTLDEVIAQINNAIKTLTARVDTLQQALLGDIKAQKPEKAPETLKEALTAKPSERGIPVSQIVERLQGIIPPEHVARQWSPASGGYRLLQQLKRVIRELEVHE